MGWGAAGALAGKLLNGALADILGGRRLFLLAMILMSVATVMFGASSAHVLFMLLNFMAQLTKAAGWPAMAKLIGAWFDAARHGRVWGVISTSSRAGSVVSSLFLGGLLVYLPWRWLFYAAGVVTALIAGLNFILLKDSPAQAGVVPSDPEPAQGGEPWLEVVVLGEDSGGGADPLREESTRSADLRGHDGDDDPDGVSQLPTSVFSAELHD